MRYIEIDGKNVKVSGCQDCPCFEEDDIVEGYCKHPSCSTIELSLSFGHYRVGEQLHDYPIREGDYGDKCPLRKVEE